MERRNKTIALMPMKGVSERVSNKNMRMFNGSPLCSVMLDKLLSSRLIDLVVVNTDSTEITNFIADKYPKERVTTVNRPAELCGHDVSMNKIIGHDIHLFEADIYVQTHATNPLLGVETIDRAIEHFQDHKSESDSLFSVTRFQTRFYSSDGTAINHDPEVLIKTQDLPVWYEENSCIYLFTKSSFSRSGKRIGESPILFQIDQMESVDIDVEEEFILAERLHKVITT